MSTIELTYLLIRNWLPELAEVPADQLVRGEPEPGVTAVGRERLASGVLAGEQKLGGGEDGVSRPRPGGVAGRRPRAGQLDAAQFAVADSRVDHDGDPGIALQVGPALAAHDGVQPQ